MDSKNRLLARKCKVIGRSPSLTLSNFSLRFFWWQNNLHRPCTSSAYLHKLAYLGRCSKFVFPIKAQPNNFFQILFQQSNCIYNLQFYEPNVKEKFLRESGFPIFGRKVYVATWKLFFWPPFCNCISKFPCFCCISVLLDYYISGQHFTVKFIRGKYFSELGSTGTPLDH